jgi:hypothetical protein
MATIEIRSWGKFVGGTAWDAHPEAELKRRMRSGVNLSQHELRVLARRVRSRESFSLPRVREEAVFGIVQILRVMGAEIHVAMDGSNNPSLFKKWPKR